MALVIALVDDLFFQAKIAEAARQLGIELRACSTSDSLLAEVERRKPGLVIVDLNARAGGIDAIVRLRAVNQDIPLLGFLSHVQAELARRAQQAGCNEILPRSKFTLNLPAILSRAQSNEAK